MTVIEEAKKRFADALDHLDTDLSKLRAGRPTPVMFENISVDAYGSRMNLSGVATVSVVDATLVTIQVWDKTLVEPVVNALQSSENNYNPQVAGQVVRIPIPQMTEEKRLQVVKQAKELTEKYRIEVRVIRKDLMDRLDDQKNGSLLSEDEYEAQKKQVQEEVDNTNKEIEDKFSQKEEAIMKV